jgi:cation diffusion facilitator CzcD-associated flavoprotein CzcO
VVIANGGAVPNLPDWVGQIATSYPQDRLLHSDRADLRGLQLQGERVLIVGGGLTSGHLALGAVERGAQVLLMSRRNVYDKLVLAIDRRLNRSVDKLTSAHSGSS